MDFDGWIGCELGEVERERFVRVHEALVAAGPPARLPPALRRPPPVARPVPFGWTMPPRRRAPQLAAAVAAVVCFGAASAGYLLSTGSGRGGDGWAGCVPPPSRRWRAGSSGLADAIRPVTGHSCSGCMACRPADTRCS